MEIKLDLRGKDCPIPVVETKKTATANPTSSILSIVDNNTAVQNLQKLSKYLNMSVTVSKISDVEYTVLFTPNSITSQSLPINDVSSVIQSSATHKDTTSNNIVVISSEFMGDGDSVLGSALMKGFIYSLTQLDSPPSSIILYNSGVKLAIANSKSLEDLKFLEDNGCEVVSCGTCLNHYELTNELGVGSVTNMYMIAEMLSSCSKIIKP